MIMDRVKVEENGSGGETAEKKRCRVCGTYTVKLYQNDTCKSCLVSSFKKLKVMIDGYRSGSHEEEGGKE